MVTPETMPRLAGQRNLFELLMIVQNPRNLSRKSSKTFVGLANKVAGGPCDHRFSSVFAHIHSSSEEFRKSIRLFGDLYLEVLYKCPLLFGGDPCEGVWRPLGWEVALAPGL